MTTKFNSKCNPQETIKTSCLTEVADILPSGEVLVNLQQNSVPVNFFVQGLPVLNVGDAVLVDILADGNVIVRARVEPLQRNRHVAEFVVEDGHAQIAMPEHVNSLSIALGVARIELNRNGQLRLNGETIVSDSNGLNQILGKPVSLN